MPDEFIKFFRDDVWPLMVDNFGFVPSLLLLVLCYMHWRLIKEWQNSAARYESEIDRISKEKSQLWSRLIELTGGERSSSEDHKPELNHRD